MITDVMIPTTERLTAMLRGASNHLEICGWSPSHVAGSDRSTVEDAVVLGNSNPPRVLTLMLNKYLKTYGPYILPEAGRDVDDDMLKFLHTHVVTESNMSKIYSPQWRSIGRFLSNANGIAWHVDSTNVHNAWMEDYDSSLFERMEYEAFGTIYGHAVFGADHEAKKDPVSRLARDLCVETSSRGQAAGQARHATVTMLVASTTAVALACRHLIPSPQISQEEYDQATRAWRTHFGFVHPTDPALEGEQSEWRGNRWDLSKR